MLKIFLGPLNRLFLFSPSFPLSPSLYSIPRFYSVAIPCILQPRHSSSTSSAPYAPNQNLLLLHGFLRSASLSATSIHALFRFFPHLFSYWNLVPHLWFSSNIYFLCVFSPFQLTSFIGSLSIFPFFWFMSPLMRVLGFSMFYLFL